MASEYPGGIDAFPTNRTNNTAMAGNHPGDHNDLADAVNKIEQTLGVDPQGSFDTVVERLDSGGSPGAVRRLDFGVITAADLADGPILLYTPAAGEVVGPFYLYDVVYCAVVDGNFAMSIGRDEMDGTTNLPPLASWDSDLTRDGAGWAARAEQNAQVPLTVGPVTAGFNLGAVVEDFFIPVWEAATVYAQLETIVAVGHIWRADPGGTSGGSAPDFAGNIGGTVADNDITWTDTVTCSIGSAHVYADVCVPVLA